MWDTDGAITRSAAQESFSASVAGVARILARALSRAGRFLHYGTDDALRLSEWLFEIREKEDILFDISRTYFLDEEITIYSLWDLPNIDAFYDRR